MNIQFVINLILGIIGLSFAAYVIPGAKLKYSFLIGYACLVFYRLYDPSTSWAGVDWIRHVVVLIGQISFFIFITNFCKKYIEVEEIESVDANASVAVAGISTSSESAEASVQTAAVQIPTTSEPSVSTAEVSLAEPPPVNATTAITPPAPSTVIEVVQPQQPTQDIAPSPSEQTQPPRSFGGMLLPFSTMGSFTSIYNYGSAEGVSHIFLAPTFLAIIAVVFTRISAYSSPFKLIAKLFALSYALGIMLHVGEFFLESHPFVTLSRDNQHNVEMFWYVVSSLTFYFTLYKFNQLLKKTNARQKTI